MKFVVYGILIYIAWIIGGDWQYALIGFILGMITRAFIYGYQCRKAWKNADNAKKGQNNK